MLGKIRNYLASSQHSKLLPIIAVVAIILAVPLTVILSQQQQDLRQRAAPLGDPSKISYDLLASEECEKVRLDLLGKCQTNLNSCSDGPLSNACVEDNLKCSNNATNANNYCLNYNYDDAKSKKTTYTDIRNARVAKCGEKQTNCYDNCDETFKNKTFGSRYATNCKNGCVSNRNYCDNSAGEVAVAINRVLVETDTGINQAVLSPVPEPTVEQKLPISTPTPATYTISGKIIIDTGNLDSLNAIVSLISTDNSDFASTNAIVNAGNYSFTSLPAGKYNVKLTVPLDYTITSLNPVTITVNDFSANKENVNFTIARSLTQEATPAEETKQPEPTTKPTTVLTGNFDASNNCLDINDFNAWFNGFKSGQYGLVDYNKWYRGFSVAENRCK